LPNPRLARRYAAAIFSLAQAGGKVESIAADLEAADAILRSDPRVQEYFLAPIIDAAEKTRVLLAAFEHRIDETALHALLLLVRKRREGLLGEILTEYQSLALAGRGREPLIVTSARPLEQSELARLVARLSERYGKEFEVRAEVDAGLIGGLHLRMGDSRIDGSCSGRLEELAAALFSRS
jgi:F-type H+-transporting ATPase subunit delta